ncbi:MAG: hypothetical protein HFI89_05050 [Lachnospiraceae bacterium]|nr:hypothetical protein [Lachnospiraceae bacterium]
MRKYGGVAADAGSWFPPDLRRGCRFCKRYFRAREICKKEELEMAKIRERHWIRCHFAKPANEMLTVES